MTGADAGFWGRACARELKRRKALEVELRHVIEVLPGPIWNAKGVLVWSMLDVNRIREALGWEGTERTPLGCGRCADPHCYGGCEVGADD